MTPREITLDEKLLSIDRILNSSVFARSDQLRRLFRWLADKV